MAKCYLLEQITIIGKNQYKKYGAQVSDVIKDFRGRYLVKGGLRMVKKGNPPFQRDVFVEFPDIDTAKRFISLKKFQYISKFRKASSSGVPLLVNWET